MQDEEGQFVPRRCDFARCRGPTRAVSTPSVCGVDCGLVMVSASPSFVSVCVE